MDESLFETKTSAVLLAVRFVEDPALSFVFKVKVQLSNDQNIKKAVGKFYGSYVLSNIELGACNELLEEVSDAAVLVLVEVGSRLCICVNDAGPAEIIKLIHTAVQGKLKRYE